MNNIFTVLSIIDIGCIAALITCLYLLYLQLFFSYKPFEWSYPIRQNNSYDINRQILVSLNRFQSKYSLLVLPILVLYFVWIHPSAIFKKTVSVWKSAWSNMVWISLYINFLFLNKTISNADWIDITTVITIRATTGCNMMHS